MREPLVDHPDRTFRLWVYTVSHSSLLLRSNKNDTFATRIDVLFKGVRWLALPESLPGLTIRVADGEELTRIGDRSGVLPDPHAEHYVVSGTGYEGAVVALTCARAEDTGAYFDPSSFSDLIEQSID